MTQQPSRLFKQTCITVEICQQIRERKKSNDLSKLFHTLHVTSVLDSLGIREIAEHTQTDITLTTIIFIIFSDFSMFNQIFHSPQVKRCAIITYKHGIYQLPHELPNDLRLRILGN